MFGLKIKFFSPFNKTCLCGAAGQKNNSRWRKFMFCFFFTSQVMSISNNFVLINFILKSAVLKIYLCDLLLLVFCVYI